MPVVNGRKVSSKAGRGFGRAEMEVDINLLPGESVTAACTRLGIRRAAYYKKLNSCRA